MSILLVLSRCSRSVRSRCHGTTSVAMEMETPPRRDSDDGFVCHYHSVERSEACSSTPLGDRLANVAMARTPRNTPPPNAAASCLCTPQPSHAKLALEAAFHDEVEAVNRAHRPCEGESVTKLAPFLYLGRFPTAETVQQLEELGTTHLITACGGDRRAPHDLPVHNLKAITFNCVDAHDYFILAHDYDAFAEAVDDARAAGGAAFVHCIAGVNRSATLCAAYLIQRMHLDPIGVVRHIRACGRPFVLENRSFRTQLVDFFLSHRQ